MVDTGLQIQWKDHQLADSSTQVLLLNIPPMLDRGGVEGKNTWHLAEIERLVKERAPSYRVYWSPPT
jgi:hypothetical protein